MKLAESIGVAEKKITCPGELKPALHAALESNEALVLDVDIDPAEAGYRNALLPIPIRWDQKPVSSPEEWARNLVPDPG